MHFWRLFFLCLRFFFGEGKTEVEKAQEAAEFLEEPIKLK